MSRADTMLDVHQPTLSPESELIAREEHEGYDVFARRELARHSPERLAAEAAEADARVAANEQRRLAEARREVAADDFDARYQRWLASDVPEARRSPDWSPERNVSAADRAEPDVQLGEGDVQLGEGDVQLGEGDVQLGEGDVQLGEGDVQLGDVQLGEGPAEAPTEPAIEPEHVEPAAEAPRPRGRRSRIDVERVRELAAAGMTITEIAAELGCWRESVWKVEKRHGIAIRRTSLAESGRLGAAVRHAAQASQETP